MTELEYMLDTYKFESEATVTEIWNNEFWNYIILDKTIFYPQWGGQPTDIWTIGSRSKILDIVNVRTDENGNVLHYISWDDILSIWDQVELEIDREIRIFNARNHSAGHLIDVAISNMWYKNLTPTRWHHFPDGSYVAYDGVIEAEEKESFIQQLQNEINSLISQNIPMIISYTDLEDNKLPTKHTHRHAHFEWYNWCGCGWTHVKSSWKIWEVIIKKISCKKWTTKISYEIKK